MKVVNITSPEVHAISRELVYDVIEHTNNHIKTKVEKI